MTLPSHHLLPSAQFRHIGLMVLFMMVLAFLSSVASLSVYDITKGWMVDTKDTLMIEIPSFDTSTQKVLEKKKIDAYVSLIEKKLSDDPLVLDLKIQQDEDLVIGNDNRFTIPSPVFITLHLHKDRAPNAEQRIIDFTKETIPTAEALTPESWQIDIQKTALSLQFLFLTLTISIFLITSILLSAIIKTHIKASEDIIQIIHLMGASPTLIARLFVASVTKPVCYGVSFAGILSILIVTVYKSFIPISIIHLHLFLCFITVGILFIFLCRTITYWTVRSSLSNMP